MENLGIWNDGTFEDGLAVEELGITAEFFCQVRYHHRLRRPSIEVSLPFLWYWDAIRDGDSWFYLNTAGRDQPLIRADIRDDSYRVEVRALELRHYLSAHQRAIIVQIDHVPKIVASSFDRVESEHIGQWCNFSWTAAWDQTMGERPAFSRLQESQKAMAPSAPPPTHPR